MALGLEGGDGGDGGRADIAVVLLTFIVFGVRGEAVGVGAGAVGVFVACDDKGEPKVKDEGGGLVVCDGGATTDDDDAFTEAMEVPIDEELVVGKEPTLLSILEVSPAWAFFLSSICAMTSW